ncbi:MAG: ATP-binding cassette domain-containing protein, partial [Carnobacterium sp.]
MTKLKVENLKKSFGSLEVLKDLNVEIQEGEVVCIIGPSGSGKSTFLRCLNQLEDISGGKVMIDNNNLSEHSKNINKIRENIGMVFQHFNLFPHLTVLENITLAPKELKDQKEAD